MTIGWGGQGVYFFVDYDIACWWGRSKSVHTDNCGAVVYKSNIKASDEEVLDLDDRKQLDKFLTESIALFKEISPDDLGRYPILSRDKMRAIFFDYYKQKNRISVIINTFSKDSAKYTMNRSSKDLDVQRSILQMTGLGFKEKQICVSRKECIVTTKLVYNEREEVI